MRPFFFLACLLFAFSALGQDSLSLQYQHYRSRFLGLDGKGGFISLGTAPGQSLPAAGRNPGIDCEQNWHLIHSQCWVRQGKGMMEWSDATVYHGHYLAVLALELHLLERQGQDSKATRRELWLALQAIDRLDDRAELLLGLPPSRNGFLLRDDVPKDFCLDSSQASGFRFPLGNGQYYQCTRSDGGCGEVNLQRGVFMSQDQILSLYMGFAFIQTFVGNLHWQDSLPSFGQTVAEQCHRITSYMQRNNWWLHTPDGRKIPERWGGNVRGFNHAIAKATARICQGRYKKTYQKRSSKTTGRFVNGAIDWGFGLQTERNYAMIYTCALLTGEWSSKEFARRCRRTDQLLYALADAVLNRRPLHRSISKTEIEQILRSAPWDGPCFGSPNCTAPKGWQAASRWWQMYFKNGNPYGSLFEYNGLDWMLFYLLYRAL
jgi:hypothetical protein